jgi:hypothetical protein
MRYPLLYLGTEQQFRYPAGRLLYKVKINSVSGLHCGKSQVQHSSKLFESQAPVLLDGSGDSGHIPVGLLGFFFWRYGDTDRGSICPLSWP